jgi:hypothetical protein
MIAASPALLAREEHIFARYTRTLASLVAEEVKRQTAICVPHDRPPRRTSPR